MRRLAALLAFAALLLSCGQQEDRPAPITQATATLRLAWLTVERQERLADVVSTLAKEHGWAAGCVFRYNADETVLDQFSRPEGRAAYSFINDSKLRPGVVVFVEGDATAERSYREVIPDPVTFCYVPE